MYDVIIIGSGPSGLTASIYAVRASLKTLVIAGYNQGGQLMLTTLVENYPGFSNGIEGPELMANMRKQAENLGVEFVDKDAVEIDISKRPFTVYTELPEKAGQPSMSLQGASVTSDAAISTSNSRHSGESEGRLQNPTGNDSGQARMTNFIDSRFRENDKEEKIARNDDKKNSGVYRAKSLIIATGADTKWLEVPGEKELIGKGVSSCAPCDAFFFRGKNVAVVGGGDSAMEEALVLAKVANLVTIIHRKAEFRASQIMQDRVLNNPKIKVIWNTKVLEVLGKEKVTGLKLEKTSLQDEVYDFPTDGVFVAIGHKPNSEKFAGKIELDEKGYVKRKEIYQNNLLKYWSATNVPGVFVAGDVHDYRYRQAVTAAGFGCMAALDAEKWLEENAGPVSR